MTFNYKINPIIIVLGAVAGIVLMIISSVYTAILFESMAHGQWLGYVLAISGVCIDIGKIVSASAMVYFFFQKKNWLAYTSLIIYVLAFCVSMVASQSLDLNKSNEIKNKMITGSDEYRLNMAMFNGSTSDLSRYADEISKLEEGRQSAINLATKSLVDQRDLARKNNWLTTPKGSPRKGVDVLNEEIIAETSKQNEIIDTKIASINSKIDTTKTNQFSLKDSITNAGSTLNYTEGIIAYAEWVNPDDPDKAIGQMYIFKNVFSECLGMFLMLLMNFKFDSKSAPSKVRATSIATTKPQKKYKVVNIKPKSKNTIKVTSPKPVANKIGFNMKEVEDSNISESDLDEYKKIMYKYSKNGISVGYKKIAEKSSILSQGKCQNIKKKLEGEGLLKTENNRTYIVG